MTTKNGMHSVFVLYTPLHVLISLRIIEINKIKEFSIFFIGEGSKINYKYYKQISERSILSIYIKDDKLGVKTFLQCFFSRKLFKNKINADFYCSNLKKLHSRIICGFVKPNRIFSMDDGSGNIAGSGYFYDFREQIFKKITLNILFPFQKLSYRGLVDKIVKNYTIFDHKNIYEKVSERIQLFNDSFSLSAPNLKKKCFYLGNAFSEDGECCENYEKYLFSIADNRFDIDYYLPHPRELREKSLRIAKNKVFESLDKIAEDLVISYVKMGYYVEIIGIYSTTLLNLSNIERVRCVNIKAKIKKPTNTLVQLLINSGVEQINICNKEG